MQSQPQKVTALVSADALLQRARELVPILAGRASKTEQTRQIPKETMADLQSAGLFDVLKPKQLGGFEMDPQVFYEIAMTLAEGCPSTGWIYGVIGVHNWQIALFDPRAAEDIWKDDRSVLIASSYMPKAKVKKVTGGFEFSGRWGFSSGVDHCQWVFLGGLIFPEGGQGEVEYRTFLVPRSDFEVVDTWQAIGLKGTGSNDVVVKGCFVPEYRTHRAVDGFLGTNPGRETFAAPLYRLPFGQIFVRAVSSAAIGALQGGLNAFLDFASARVGDMGNKTAEQAPAQLAAAEVAVDIDEMKLVLNRNFAALMTAAENNQSIDVKTRLHYRHQAAVVVERCAHAAYKLFAACGARAVFSDFLLSRFLLDIYAARGHYANNPEQFGRNYGSVLLGRDNTDFFI